MQNADRLASQKQWQQARMLRLHEICLEVDEANMRGEPLSKAIRTAVQKHEFDLLQDGEQFRPLRLSEPGLKTKFHQWKSGGKSMLVFVPKFRGGRPKIPRDLIQEYQRRQTLPGVSNAHAAWADITSDWSAGKDVPGLGTWTRWYADTYPGAPLPKFPPDFPYSYQSMQRYKPPMAQKEWGNKGLAAARKHLPFITRSSKNLRPSELFVFDDVRLDLIAVDEATKQPTEHQVYIAMEWGTRYIPAYVMRPGNAMLQADVDELVLMTLQSCGIGKDYPTHLLFERGTLTMSPGAAKTLERVSDGRIKIHFSSMNRSRPYAGAPMESGKGHFMAKSVIESFMRQLHSRLMLLPGQRGNKYANAPDTLGWSGQGASAKRGTLVDEANKLLDIQLAFDSRIRLNLGLLWSSELNKILRDAINAHNNHRDHTYEGFGQVTQIESAPDVWEEAHV